MRTAQMVISGKHPSSGESIDIDVRNGVIERVERSNSPGDRYVSPGWIDIQVNGFAGVDYNHPSTPLDEIARSIEVQRTTGVARLYPTVITGSHENICGSLRNLAHAKRTLNDGHAMPGFHVEGPWISALDGPRGAHPIEHVRAPSIDEYKRFQEAAEGGVRLVTLGPEHDGSTAVIEHMVADGVVVSLGHTNATANDIAGAIKAGATMSTHLGNGAHAEVPRHDNYITHQLAADELYAGLIVDGIHLPPAWVKVAVRAKGLEKSILVTDAVAPAHCPPGIYRIGHLEVELLPEQRVELTDSRRLAGSALSMDRGVGNLIEFAGVSLFDATRFATVNPAKAMGITGRDGYLDPGQTADLTLFTLDPDGTISVEETILAN
jgi:N-acetylglucosamine-6-phosphate deacetylase